MKNKGLLLLSPRHRASGHNTTCHAQTFGACTILQPLPTTLLYPINQSKSLIPNREQTLVAIFSCLPYYLSSFNLSCYLKPCNTANCLLMAQSLKSKFTSGLLLDRFLFEFACCLLSGLLSVCEQISSCLGLQCRPICLKRG